MGKIQNKLKKTPKTLVYPGHKLERYHIEVDSKDDPSAPSEKKWIFS